MHTARAAAPAKPQEGLCELDSTDTHIILRYTETNKRTLTQPYPFSYDELWTTIKNDNVFDSTKLKEAINAIDRKEITSKKKFLLLSSLLIRADVGKDGGALATSILNASGLYKNDIDITLTPGDLLDACKKVKDLNGHIVCRYRATSVVSSPSGDALKSKMENTPFGTITRKILHDAGLGAIHALSGAPHILLGSIAKYFDPSSRSKFDGFIPYTSSKKKLRMKITNEGIQFVTGEIELNEDAVGPHANDIFVECISRDINGVECFEYIFYIFGKVLRYTPPNPNPGVNCREADSNRKKYNLLGNAINSIFFKSAAELLDKCISIFGKGWGDKGQNQCGILQLLLDILINNETGNNNGGITTLLTHDGPLLLTNYLLGSVLPLLYTSRDHEQHIDIVALFSITNSSIENAEDQLRLQVNETKEEWVSTLKTLYRLAKSGSVPRLFSRQRVTNITNEFFVALFADMRCIFAYITILVNMIPCCEKKKSKKDKSKKDKLENTKEMIREATSKSSIRKKHEQKIRDEDDDGDEGPLITDNDAAVRRKIEIISKINKIIEILRKCTPSNIVTYNRNSEAYKMPDTLPRYIECKNTDLFDLFYYITSYLEQVNLLNEAFGIGGHLATCITDGDGQLENEKTNERHPEDEVDTQQYTEEYDNLQAAYDALQRSYMNVERCCNIQKISVPGEEDEEPHLVGDGGGANNDSELKTYRKTTHDYVITELDKNNQENAIKLNPDTYKRIKHTNRKDSMHKFIIPMIGTVFMCASKFHLLITLTIFQAERRETARQKISDITTATVKKYCNSSFAALAHGTTGVIITAGGAKKQSGGGKREITMPDVFMDNLIDRWSNIEEADAEEEAEAEEEEEEEDNLLSLSYDEIIIGSGPHGQSFLVPKDVSQMKPVRFYQYSQDRLSCCYKFTRFSVPQIQPVTKNVPILASEYSGKRTRHTPPSYDTSPSDENFVPHQPVARTLSTPSNFAPGNFRQNISSITIEDTNIKKEEITIDLDIVSQLSDEHAELSELLNEPHIKDKLKQLGFIHFLAEDVARKLCGKREGMNMDVLFETEPEFKVFKDLISGIKSQEEGLQGYIDFFNTISNRTIEREQDDVPVENIIRKVIEFQYDYLSYLLFWKVLEEIKILKCDDNITDYLFDMVMPKKGDNDVDFSFYASAFTECAKYMPELRIVTIGKSNEIFFNPAIHGFCSVLFELRKKLEQGTAGNGSHMQRNRIRPVSSFPRTYSTERGFQLNQPFAAAVGSGGGFGGSGGFGASGGMGFGAPLNVGVFGTSDSFGGGGGSGGFGDTSPAAAALFIATAALTATAAADRTSSYVPELNEHSIGDVSDYLRAVINRLGLVCEYSKETIKSTVEEVCKEIIDYDNFIDSRWLTQRPTTVDTITTTIIKLAEGGSESVSSSQIEGSIPRDSPSPEHSGSALTHNDESILGNMPSHVGTFSPPLRPPLQRMSSYSSVVSSSSLSSSSSSSSSSLSSNSSSIFGKKTMAQVSPTASRTFLNNGYYDVKPLLTCRQQMLQANAGAGGDMGFRYNSIWELSGGGGIRKKANETDNSSLEYNNVKKTLRKKQNIQKHNDTKTKVIKNISKYKTIKKPKEKYAKNNTIKRKSYYNK